MLLSKATPEGEGKRVCGFADMKGSMEFVANEHGALLERAQPGTTGLG
jgi:hypothetical protein